MPEARYPCPVCLGLPMKKIEFQKPPLTLDSCGRCGGMWFDYGEVNLLKQMNPKLALQKIALREQDFKMQCHQCEAFMDRNAEKCPQCNWKNHLDCPICQKTMDIARIGDIKLDYCKSCKGAWFDNAELAQLWNGRLDRMTQDYKQDNQSALLADDGPNVFLDVLTYSPHLAFYAAEAAVDLAVHVPEIAAGAFELAANAPEVAGSLIEGLGDVAGSIFEVIADILGGLFN
jgi:Zn-finger nucleic acid-binding protein